MAPSQIAFVNDGRGWVGLPGQVKQISGAANDTLYAIGTDNAVYVNHNVSSGGTGWTDLGGQVSQISAGMDASGKTDVFAIGTPSTHAFINDGNGWVDFGCSAVEIAAPAFGVAVPGNTFAIAGSGGQHCVHSASGVTLLPQSEVTPLFSAGNTYKDYSQNPLFARGGPSAERYPPGRDRRLLFPGRVVRNCKTGPEPDPS